MKDVLFPSTDAGALAQTIGVIAVAIVTASLLRRERALVMLIIGLSMVVLGFFGIRALH